jgi:Cation efflux family
LRHIATGSTFTVTRTLGRHRHLRFALRESEPVLERGAPRGDRRHSHDQDHSLAHSHAHGHSHGLVDRSIIRSREGVRAVALSLAILGLTAVAQLAILFFSNSVALLADLVHNFGDALTAVPLGIAFLLRSLRGEKLAGLAIVLAIFISACVALYETVQRFLHPEDLTHLWVLATAGAIGFAGNELAARVRLSAVAVSQAPRWLQTATMLRPMASSPSGSSRARSSLPSEPRSAIRSSASSSRS